MFLVRDEGGIETKIGEDARLLCMGGKVRRGNGGGTCGRSPRSDGRRISIGDCALFKPPQESPPFIGIIRWLTGKEDNIKLGVNWLYRPSEVKLAKGILLEAAPNEVFYSFHKDEIPAASLLHPCKVAFLRKGVELPSGISSFVCRRVYDIANKCLWWLTDQDYINERQEEVDQLLDKTRLEMQAAVQSGGRSPKPLNSPSSTPQLKPGSDSVQNSASSFPSQGKGRKRGERGDQGSEPIKRERLSKTDDGDSGNFRPENMLKSEIAKITEKGGLVDFEGVEKLVQLMQPDRAEKKIDLAGRIMLADVIAATDRFDCLGRFLHLRGLPVLDEWLQEVHKGKIGDSTSPKESDKSVEEFLLALLRALDKLPVNLHALQTCLIGKSVNNLRSHKNLEIQKKARSLVDTWKKRVEVEMNINDAKSGSSQAVSWPSKPGFTEISHGGSRRTGGSSEVAIKSSVVQPSASKTVSVKVGHGDSVKSASASPGSVKMSTPSPASMGVSSKDLHCKMGGSGGTTDLPSATPREEKSSSSSQSQNNSQSCSSDHAKTVGSSSKEDARSSTAASMNVNKTSSSASRHRKSSNGYTGTAASGIQKETALGKCSSLNRNSNSEKVSQSAITSEKPHDMPSVDHGNSHRLIVRFPNPGRSPARSASGGSFDDPSIMVSRASSPALSEKHDNYDRKVKGRSDAFRANNVADVNTESWQSNDTKDVLAASDEGDGSPAAIPDEERCRNGDEIGKTVEASKATCSSSGNNPKSGKSFEASFNSINALVESCVKYSEASASMSAGDDLGMNLLASVAAGEISKSDPGSPIGSPGSSSPVVDDSYMGNDAKLRLSREDVGDQRQGQSDDGKDYDIEKHGGSKATLSLPEEKKPTVEYSETSSMVLQPIADSCLKSEGRPNETTATSMDVSNAEVREDAMDCDGATQLDEKKMSGVVGVGNDGGLDMKSKMKSGLLDEKKKVDNVDEEIADSSMPVASDLVHGSAGVECDLENTTSVTKVEKEVVDESSQFPSLEMDGGNKNVVHEGLTSGISTEQKPLTVHANCPETTGENGDDTVLPSGSGKGLGPESINEVKGERADNMEIRSHGEKNENQRKEQVSPVIADHKNEATEDDSDKKDVVDGESTPHGEPPTVIVQETDQGLKSNGAEADDKEECTSAAEALSVAAGSDMSAKLDFDLNEGFPVDEGNQGEQVTSSAVHLPSPLPFIVSSMSSGLPASITVAAALKGPFVPPENLLKSKGELGWKGSAATSAFRPAEPRKVLEMPLGTTDTPTDATANKQSRPLLDIDLNVADDRGLEDTAPQSSAQETGSGSGTGNNRDLGRGEMLSSSTPARSAGLDLDLNRVDESTDIGQFTASTSRRVDVPILPVRSSSSSGHSNGEVNVLRDFDLNNGPGLDEMGTEPAPRSQHAKSGVPFLPPVAGIRMNNPEIGSLSSWFPPGNSYSAVTIPSILPDRGEQPYSIVATGGAQRILGPPTGGSTFGPDVYRGPVLSSSPAVAFTPAAPYPYPGFPFGTSFPLPSTSFSGGSTTYMDSTSGGGLCYPSQFVGPAGTLTPHYPRPYVISLPDGSSNGGADSSRKWGRQGLDLNAGPGSTDIEGRDERLSSASRQLSVASSQALVEEQARMYQAAGAVLKRKEPEGGWDAERFSYKQSSWQ